MTGTWKRSSAVASPAPSTAPSPSARRRRTEDDLAAELLTRREFWNRVERGDARLAFVAVFKSRKWIDEHVGEEATDIAEKLFIEISRFATSDADAEARLSHEVFAVYWSTIGRERFAMEVFQRWFPLHIKTSHHDMPIETEWFALEVSPGETSRDVFDRLASHVDADALPRGWDGQVG